jgi:hypothetical protein
MTTEYLVRKGVGSNPTLITTFFLPLSPLIVLMIIVLEQNNAHALSTLMDPSSRQVRWRDGRAV